MEVCSEFTEYARRSRISRWQSRRRALIGHRCLSCGPAWNHQSGYGYGEQRERLKNLRGASEPEGDSEEGK